MDLERSDEQAALAATVRSVLATHAPITPYVRSIVDGAATWSPEDRAWVELVAIGTTELPSLTDAAIVAEELGRCCYPGPWVEEVAGRFPSPDAEVVLRAADALGAAAAVMEVAVQYAKDRQQFGRPIGAFQAVAHLCVDMLETVELARGGILHAAWAADAGDPDAHLAALRCTAFGDRLVAVAETAIQVLGGIGYTWEHDAHLWYKRLLTWSSVGGPASRARVALGRSLLSR